MHEAHQHDDEISMTVSQDNTEALLVALQHPHVASDPDVVCRITQTCRGWRAAVQNSAAGLLVIKFIVKPSSGWDELAALAQWLPRHPGTVGRVDVAGRDVVHGLLGSDHREVADMVQQAELALAECFRPVPATPPAASGIHPQLLKLRSFSSWDVCSHHILSALPAAHLTELTMHLPRVPLQDPSLQEHSSDGSACEQHLRRLTSLQRLHVFTCFDKLPPGWTAALSSLTQLTELVLSGIAEADVAKMALLPPELRQLTVSFFDYSRDYNGPGLYLQHLTKLQHLSLKDIGLYFQPDSQLAPNITSLRLEYDFLDIDGDTEALLYPLLEHLNVTSLQQLRKLKLEIEDEAWDFLPLVTMTQLTHVRLTYANPTAIDTTAGLWHAIPGLVDLTVMNTSVVGPLDLDIYEAMMEAVGVLTGLTSIFLGVSLPEQQGLSFCGHLTGLSNLVELHLLCCDGGSVVQARDMLHVTHLTRLTRLVIEGVPHPAMDGVTAVALACQLTNLRWLGLNHSGPACLCAIPAIAVHQTKLQRLELDGLGGRCVQETNIDGAYIDEACLMMLTTLKCLTHLSPDYSNRPGPEKDT